MFLKKGIIAISAVMALSSQGFAADVTTITKATIKLIEDNQKLSESIDDHSKILSNNSIKVTEHEVILNKLDSDAKKTMAALDSVIQEQREDKSFRESYSNVKRDVETLKAQIASLKSMSDSSLSTALNGPVEVIKQLIAEKFEGLDARLAVLEKDKEAESLCKKDVDVEQKLADYTLVGLKSTLKKQVAAKEEVKEVVKVTDKKEVKTTKTKKQKKSASDTIDAYITK